MKNLFDELVAASGLSPIFAERAMEVALAKAGVGRRDLTAGDLARALPQIERTLGFYLDAADAQRRFAVISKLASC